ncbi:tRNA (adenosine(37)-N6)-threonylcarbamoyltransferase complex dimerization subunit type 1 TsaB [Crocinitomicaceae bacterium CZZ-1]|uniref:tRNA (Adenosine(37)-N6)-threonylcarbamoyltransferase complex dimerization subunit type 1 TsaB n=1 Tax=Taishania pollutisoli TaxID=2766479 RepID=A0A8J6PID3_9FLAO|nr:tRNA (adenosine(37)-N6)-threonylcarbamoyltransferase complex dimerization subunit type 1 TsaB [Taishania pollutisoli]MBC9812171.1 tRNA (adenosine(37)-N6)-threonylcarbamoyltransferase complex dimerization subunit type 1 TsaB [Taishania pollutisoli]MBX2950589.1 tRNA (adenosine(37)-N6)-threonylcarbamoyltransferase complex dimerization subunit type 1 TsaB [Crocinitomicaceae bacterium]NGF74668.1 tRNA (adenosine(37)-N6)-threonylcarbamoyltransferase complex dimerization subunit type 1 TsaB [Fluviico
MDCYILHLETATKVCSVALSNNGKLVALKETGESEYVHGEVITLFIEAVLQQAEITPRQLTAVSVTAGPGSYTGLRIGVSTAKGLCYALNIPLIAIDALYNLAVLAKETHPDTTICAMIDARRMEVFSSIYRPDLTLSKPVSADILDENAYREFEPFIAVGDGSYKMQEIWKNRKIIVDTAIKSSAAGHVIPAYEKFRNHQLEDVAYFEPFYLKDFVGTSKK